MEQSRTSRDGFRPRRNLKDEVATFLRDRILSGDFRPGTKIDQDAVALAMGVSKLPVREALITLASEGMIENVPRRGSFVADLAPDDLRDHYAVYGLVSGLAAERAATQIDEEALADLDTLLDAMERTTDPAALGDLNFDFHQTINRIGASMRLRSVLRLLSQNLPTRFFEMTTDWPEQAEKDHRGILEALRRHDARAAATLMSEHLKSGGDYAVRMLQESGFWDESTASDPTLESVVTATE